jgi:CRISPR system Cascade subunit CasD
MMNAMVFVVEAPMAAWGARLGGTVRTSDAIPTHSALIGMAGAALGLARGDERLNALSTHYASAVWVVKQGERMTDFHTVETPIETGFVVGRPRTRWDELSGKTVTTITRREYLMDVRHVVALVPVVDEPVFTPNELADALKTPVFTLFAGRRSCSLSAPLRPELLDADQLETFLSIATVWDSRIATAAQGHSVRQRTDLLISAEKRRFMVRDEVVR